MPLANIPQPSMIDYASDFAARADEACRGRIRAEHLRQDLVHAFADAIAVHASGPLADLVGMLIDEPIRDDAWDLPQFIKSQGAMDGERLAKELLELVGRVSLTHYRQEVDDRDF
jgi:hypothetical protein